MREKDIIELEYEDCLLDRALPSALSHDLASYDYLLSKNML